jgi:hypothetical protein
MSETFFERLDYPFRSTLEIYGSKVKTDKDIGPYIVHKINYESRIK